MSARTSFWVLGLVYAGASILTQFILSGIGLGSLTSLGEAMGLLAVLFLYKPAEQQMPKSTAAGTAVFARVLIIGLNFVLAPQLFVQAPALAGVLGMAVLLIAIDYWVFRYGSKAMAERE